MLALLLCLCYDAYHLLASLPNCHVKPLTHLVLANRWLAVLPLCSAPLIALLVAGEDWRPFLVGTFIFLLISLNCYVILMHLYTWWRVEGLASCLVFCSILAALVSVIPVLCSLILPSKHGWVLWEPLDSLLWIKLLQQGPTLVLPFTSPCIPFPWVLQTQGSSLF